MADFSPLRRACKMLLLTALAGLLLVRGIVPAWEGISDDFPEYFTAAKSVRDGEDAVKLYDGDWFRLQTRHYQVGTRENPGEFTPYPPATALLLTPLAGVKPLTALRVVTALNVVCLICAAFLLSRIFVWSLIDSAGFVLVSGWALQTGLRFGHPYILISTCCLLGYLLHLKRRPWLAGLCLGVFVPIKYYPLAVLAGFALNRQWRVALGGVFASLAVTLLSIGVLGWKVHQLFLQTVVLNHLTGHLIPGPRFIAIFQSIDTLFERLFVFDPIRNPHPWISAPQLAAVAIMGSKVLLVLAAAAGLVKIARTASMRAIAPSIGLLGVLALLIAPGSGTYAFVLLWLPVGLLVHHFSSEGARLPAQLILSAYVLIGFIPYGLAYTFEGDGGLTLLAYPRLILLLAMFLICLYAVAFPSDAPPSNRILSGVQNV